MNAWVGKLANGSISTIQSLPWDMRGWHCGGKANDTHIGFEILEDDLNDKAYFELVYKEAVELCVYLCRMFKLDPLADGVLIDHAEGYKRGLACNHADTGHWFPKHGKNMNIFRSDVNNMLTGKNTPVVIPPVLPADNIGQPIKTTSMYPISEANLKAMVDLQIVQSPEYWRNVTSVQWLDELMGKVAKPGMCDRFINNGIPNFDIALQTLVDAGVIESPLYWRGIAESKSIKYIEELIINMANKALIILEKIVYAEAQGEDEKGQILVCNTIMNRIKHKGFPSSIYEVVFQQGQFAPIDDGGYKKAKPTEKVKLSVKKSFIVDYSKGALYFRTVKGATPDCWHERNLTRLFDHGGHRFYK